MLMSIDCVSIKRKQIVLNLDTAHWKKYYIFYHKKKVLLMFSTWLIKGDCHGDFNWMFNGCLGSHEPEQTAIIVLGDFGVNYYLNKTDWRKKKELNDREYTFYVVRGNHEARPQDVFGMIKRFDENVHGTVYIEPEFPNIRYFLDYGLYDIAGYTCFVIGGAYSVDKHWRLMRAGMTEETNDPKKTGWFTNEQLTKEEMAEAEKQLYNFTNTGKCIDFIFTHTCPHEWEPADLFLGAIDQCSVDKSMETWMDKVKDICNWHVWLFGHYHADRLERPHVEMFYKDLDTLENIHARWRHYDRTGEFPWWLRKSPMFYAT